MSRRNGYESLTAQVDNDLDVIPLPAEQRRRAQLQVASYAGRTGLGMDGAAELLTMLGIHPGQDDDHAGLTTVGVPVAAIHR